ncbi:dTMP kinase [Fundicoccus culcitae]|uniref:Thymidylate kinase n=1 Tax=Fundicoccus culcitae TaxID=2969821 RepID=A0ABY5P340_9LACT|nr:dTMP kinase [Fundicoccus culcitae]UUX33142.1 dTMP kinase [Fundicoccus culcitae]
MQSGKFITIEGPDGAGKTTVIKKLVEKLTARGMIELFVTREPGGSAISEQIREVILDVNNTAMDARTEALLYAAARRQHLVEKIIPALEAGKLVICDRFIDSSLAYQGIARNIPTDEIWAINRFAIQDYLPDLTLLIDVPAEVGLKRIYAAKDNRQFDRLDQEGLAFHNMVRQAFLSFEKEEERMILIDGTQDIDTVVDDCIQVLETHKMI